MVYPSSFLLNFTTYQDVRDDVRVVVVEAGANLLGSFDSHLQSYVKRKFESRRIEVMTCSAVKRVCAETVELERTLSPEELAHLPSSSPQTVVTELPFGICVWATGNEALDFVKSLRLSSVTGGSGRGRILVDDHLRVLDDSIPFHRDIFALGDCAADKDRPLGLLAQVWKIGRPNAVLLIYIYLCTLFPHVLSRTLYLTY